MTSLHAILIRCRVILVILFKYFLFKCRGFSLFFSLLNCKLYLGHYCQGRSITFTRCQGLICQAYRYRVVESDTLGQNADKVTVMGYGARRLERVFGCWDTRALFSVRSLLSIRIFYIRSNNKLDWISLYIRRLPVRDLSLLSICQNSLYLQKRCNSNDKYIIPLSWRKMDL